MNTSSRTLLSLALTAAMLFLFSGSGLCEAPPPSFSNADIEKYRSPSDNRPYEQGRAAPHEKTEGNKKVRGKEDPEYWCKRTTSAKKEIEKAGREVREQEEAISREESKTVRTARKMNTLQSRLKKAKDHLYSAESGLTDIEHEAHRKGIKPGWLRCQFD